MVASSDVGPGRCASRGYAPSPWRGFMVGVCACCYDREKVEGGVFTPRFQRLPRGWNC